MDYFQREFSIMKLRLIPNYGIENHAPMDGDQIVCDEITSSFCI